MKYLIPLLFFASLGYGQSPCFPGFNSNFRYINHFEFNSLFNILSGENGDYTVYSIDEFTTSVSLGETYSMQVASESAPLNNRFTAWIDFNNDGVFSPDEIVLDNGVTGGKYKHELVTIPVDTNYIGIRRLRIMMAESTDLLDPCGNYYYGEAEDYFITITDSYVEPCYCTPFVDYGSGARIEDFHLADILNCNSGVNQPSYYTFYPDSVFTTNLEIGKTYRMLVSQGTNAGIRVGMRVNIDYNDNYMFEPSECIFVSSAPGPGIAEKYYTVPNDTSIIGQHRMRARISYRNTPFSGCTWASGETEDYIVNIVAQDTNQIIVPDWEKTIHLLYSQRVYDVTETYDSGYAIISGEGLNLPRLRLIKLSIDGDTLWTKAPTSNETNYPFQMDHTNDGGFIVCGYTEKNVPNGEPYVLKLDACGDIQWHETYGTGSYIHYASHVIQASDSNYVAILKYLSDSSRIALFKLDSIGNVIWQNDYTHNFGSEPRDLIETSDQGYLITGFTYTFNPGDSVIVWLRSMAIKVDSSGNEEWEKVLGTSDIALSYAFSSVELETGGFLVSTCNIDPVTFERSLGVYKIDESGNLLLYKTISGPSDVDKYGLYIRKMEGDNYCIVTGLFNDCYDYTSGLGLYMIDSDANVLDSAFVKDYYLDIQGAVVTEDNKLVVSGSKAFPNHKDVFVYKFNQDLEFDTLYNMALNYDWICDLIIYQPEIEEEEIAIDVYPNPACDGIYLKINEPDELQYQVQIVGMDGAVLKGEYIYSNELKYFSFHDLSSGMYIITVTHNNQILSSRKIIKSR